jgi:hypothetical protein
MLLNRERERGCYTATKKDREEHFARLWQKKKVGETTMRHLINKDKESVILWWKESLLDC